jgi:anti-sigma regulatory factor (Ser/Thr protein kinase)
MLQPPRNSHDAPKDLDSVGPSPAHFPTQPAPFPSQPTQSPARFPTQQTQFPAQFPTQFATPSGDGPPTRSQVRVRTRTVRQVVVLEVVGRLSEVVDELDWAIQLALATGPRGVACDLSAATEASDSDGLEMLATAGRHVRDWQAIPVAMASPDPRVRDALSAYPLATQLIVSKSMLSALYAVLRTPAPAVEWLHLTPHPTAPRAARDFVTRALLDWGLARVIPSACLVISELVTNSTLHAGNGSDIDVSVAWNRRTIRLTVRDQSRALPRRLHPGLDLHGRGLTIVAGVSRAFGVLPTANGGKVVWAVLGAPRPSASTRGHASDHAAARATNTAPATDAAAAAAAASASATTGAHVALATRTTAPRPFAVGRVGPSKRSHPRPYLEPANHLG